MGAPGSPSFPPKHSPNRVLNLINTGSHSLLTLVLQVVLSSTVGPTSFQTMTSSLVYKTSPLVQPSPYNVLHTNNLIGGDPMDRYYQQYKTTHSIRSSMGTHQYLLLTLTISTTSLMEGSPVTLHNTQLMSTCTLDREVRGGQYSAKCLRSSICVVGHF